MRIRTPHSQRGLALAGVGVAGALVLAGLAPTPALALSDTHPGSAQPDFGPNVKIFDATTPVDEINAYLLSIAQETEFSANRHAVFFKPGTYGSAAGADDPATATGTVNSTVGYYTSIAGLGPSPDDVRINGALHVDPGNTLTNFWRSLSNIAINPIQKPVGTDATSPSPAGVEDPHTMSWAVSQATPLRRVHITGNLDLTGKVPSNAFGSTLTDSRVDGAVISGDSTVGPAQAQWYTRDSQIGSWNGIGVNTVFSGVKGAPASNFATGGVTSLPSTPISRGAPFLFLDKNQYKVFVPSAKTNSSGANWSTSRRDGDALPIADFYIAKPTDTAATINRALAKGKNLLVTPGIYALEAPIRVTRDDTVVLGIGYPSLQPSGNFSALEVGDVSGAVVSGMLVDAGPQTDVLVRVGAQNRNGHHDDHRNRSQHTVDPTTLSDIFVRVGGPRAGQATTSMQIDSDDVLLDNTWLWRADHGTGAGWTSNLADHGLVVNGDDVTALGLFVEHYQKNQVIWNGERGQTLFYQSEMPYDPPTQADWMNGTKLGYASYVVSPGVRAHTATGLAVYGLFFNALFGPAHVHIHASSAIETPVSPKLRFTSIATAIIIAGGIDHVINDAGPAVDATVPNSVVAGMTAVTRFPSYPG